MLASKLQPFITRYDEISALLVQPDILNDIKRITELSKEQSDLEELVQKARLYLDNIQSIKENKTLLDDKELGDLAKEEIKEAELENENLESEIKILLLPKDPNDEKNIYLELRAGTGGDEAGIFVGDLFKAYEKVYQYMNGGSDEGSAKKRDLPKQTSGQFGTTRGLDLDLRDSDLPINRR